MKPRAWLTSPLVNGASSNRSVHWVGNTLHGGVRVPDLAELPPYCAFYDRCERATSQCRAGIPSLIGQTRQAACIHSELAESVA